MSILFAIANLAALVLVLSLRKDKPLPEWPSMLGINTLVSIFSSIIKFGLLFCVGECLGELKWIRFERPRAISDFDLFDSASRSPWGALKLISRHPMNVISTFGAAITVFAIAIDPFTQQVLQFYSCPMPDSLQSASISRSNNYTTGVQAVDWPVLDPKMSAALYQSLLNPFLNAISAFSAFCPSGNCSFATIDDIAYSTLAVCPSVRDISNTVTGSGALRGTLSALDINYTLPSEFNITSPSVLGTAVIPPNTTHLGPNPLFEFELLVATTNCPEGYNYSDVALGHCVMIPFAAYVSLTPCVLTYGDVRVANGTFDETVKCTILLDDSGWNYQSVGNHSSVAGTDCAGLPQPEGSKTMLTALKSLEDIDDTLGIVRCANGHEIDTALGRFWDYLYYDPAWIFTLDSDTALGLASSLGDMFGGKDNPQVLWLNRGFWEPAMGDNWIRVFWNYASQVNTTSVSRVMEGLTTPINNVLRNWGDPSNSEPIRGVVMVEQTCVGVDWAWLALPVTLCAWTLRLLILTVVQSHIHTHKRSLQGSRTPWKTSSLPLLWSGLLDTVKYQHGRLDSLEQIHGVSDTLKIRLDADGQLSSTGKPGPESSPARQRLVLRSVSS